jgi:putative hydrolase of the HAD superfamily
VRGLIVDWGGVLTYGVFDAFDAFCATEGLPSGSIATAFREEPARSLLVGFECGRIPPAEFEERLAAHLGVAPGELLNRLFAGGADTLDPAMHDAVERFHTAGVRTAVLSNSWGADRYDRRRWAAMFDTVVLSCDHGSASPTRRSTRSCWPRSGCRPRSASSSTTSAATSSPRRRWA